MVPNYVPLVISVIALLSSIFTLLRALLETAEGYKKCGELTIGPWSRITWRRWRWFELRFETHFIAPKISLKQRLLDTNDVRRTGVVSLRKRDPSRNIERGFDWRPFSRWSRGYAVRRCTDVLDESLRVVEDVEVERELEAQQGKGRLWRGERTFLSSNTASWLVLLRSLRSMAGEADQGVIALGGDGGQPQGGSEVQPQSGDGAQPQGGNGTQLQGGDGARPQDGDEARPPSSDRVETEVVVAFLEWTWDIMPKEASRPMAQTTLGELIVLGYRMGMRWNVNLDKEAFVAVGQGFILTCNRVQDMGLVASFSDDGWRDTDRTTPRLIPNRAADKMMCGIIPVWRSLVGDDIECTSDNRETDVLAALVDRIDPNGYLGEVTSTRFAAPTEATVTALKPSSDPPTASTKVSSTRTYDRDASSRMMTNEAVLLLCEFLPLPAASSATLHYFPGWTSAQSSQHFCVLSSPRGRSALIHGLLKFTESDSQQHGSEESNPEEGIFRRGWATIWGNAEPTMREVSELRVVLIDLDDLNSRVDRELNLAKFGGRSWQMPFEYVVECERIHDRVQDWFVAEMERGEFCFGKTEYVYLAAAHCYMLIKVSRNILEENPSLLVTREELFESVAYAYLKDLEDYVDGKGKGHLWDFMYPAMYDTTGDMYSHDLVRTTWKAWCFMMMKGIAWSMSTSGTSLGEPVPSSCFDHPRNVWVA